MEVRGSSLGSLCLVLRTIRQIDAVCCLEDLRIPPADEIHRIPTRIEIIVLWKGGQCCLLRGGYTS